MISYRRAGLQRCIIRHRYGMMRRWLLREAYGDVLEVSVGTGRNFEVRSFNIMASTYHLPSPLWSRMLARTSASSRQLEVDIYMYDHRTQPYSLTRLCRPCGCLYHMPLRYCPIGAGLPYMNARPPSLPQYYSLDKRDVRSLTFTDVSPQMLLRAEDKV